MEQISNEILFGFPDPEVNAVLARIGDVERPITRHFSHGEDFFVELEGPYTVGRLPIHHDVRSPQAGAAYRAALRDVVAQLAALAPQAFCDLAYLFDPRDTLRPCFYRVYRIGAVRYLYLLRLDLSMRPGEAEMVERGTNDLTPSFRGRRLFLDAMVIPVEDEIREDGRLRGFRIRQVVSETWIGESGRWAYDKKGVWMDADLTKFFTRLFVPSGTRIYPWYPYACRFKTVVETVIDLSAAGRAEAVPLLHRGLSFLEPWMPRIEAEMRARDFTEDIEFFVELKAQVPQGWYAPWERVRVQSYLNAAEMREFRVED